MSAAHFYGCDQVRSYATSYRTKDEALDNQYGDLVVADFNFDGMDDVAMIHDSGGNGGPLYLFLIQEDGEKFHEDTFLTNSMILMPYKIDTIGQCLFTDVYADVCHYREHQFHFNGTHWQEVKDSLINICESR